MKTLSQWMRDWRAENRLTMSELSSITGIDQALISKYENGVRLPSSKHIQLLAEGMGVSWGELHKSYLTEKVVQLIAYEENVVEIMKAAESRIEYLRSQEVFELPAVSALIQEKLVVADNLKAQWKLKRPANKTQVAKMEEAQGIEYTYESNRIEGNTLTLQETHMVVNEGVTIGGKEIREHLEAINHVSALEWIRDLATGNEELSRRNLLSIHQLVLRVIDSENAGVYRKVPVRISGSEHLPPEPYLLDKMMEDFFIHYQNQKRRLHPILLAAEMHERLVSIHPFIDGNGRTARLLMNFILLQHGFTIAILKGDPTSRMAYYKALEAVQVHNDPEPFYMLIVDKVIESLQDHLKMA